MGDENWVRVGLVEDLRKKAVQEVHIGGVKVALTFKDGEFGAISGICNHVGGPLGLGKLEGEFLVCPWHAWKFHRCRGTGEPGFEADCVPSHSVKIEGDAVLVSLKAVSQRNKLPHPLHPLAREIKRVAGRLRVLGISTTVMDARNPRYSTSEALLEVAMDHARSQNLENKLIRLNDLKFRHCEGYYSKSSRACTWPCSITQMDPQDEMEKVYEAVVHWADVVLIATPIRWGAASSLYFKMAERMNCIQNQITIQNKVLIQNKVAGFIITGGQDNVQAVAGQLLGFFSELGFSLSPFPYIAHSLGWTAENMEKNVRFVEQSAELRDASKELLDRCTETASKLLGDHAVQSHFVRSGRKASGDLKRNLSE